MNETWQARIFSNASLIFSGLAFFWQVRYLKIIEKSGYQALPWVRYITQNGGRLTVHPMLVLSAHMCMYWATVGQCSAVWWELTLYRWKSLKRGYTIEHKAMWQRPAKCEKVNLFFLFCRGASLNFVLSLPRLHMLAFFLMLPLIAKHPHLISFCIPFILGGKHQLPPLDFSPIPPFSLSIWLSLCPFPPQITSSGPSRQCFSRQ